MRFFVIPSEDAEARRKWLSERLGTEEMNALFQEAYAILRNKEAAYDAVYNALLKGLKCNRLRDDNRMFYQMVQFVRNEAYAYPKHFQCAHGGGRQGSALGNRLTRTALNISLYASGATPGCALRLKR